jgi:GNAT superfamily N-acetyltransferase
MRSGVITRLARPGDWLAVEDIFIEAGKAAWDNIFSPDQLKELHPPERWKEAIYSVAPDTAMFIAELQDRVIGFCVVRPSGDPDAMSATGEVDGFYTHPRIWGVGAGQALMEDALERLRSAGFVRATLWTEERNHRARRFYEVWGWMTNSDKRTRIAHGAEITELRYWINLLPI